MNEKTKTLQPPKIEYANGYYEIFKVHNEELCDILIDTLTEYIDATKEQFDPKYAEDVHFGKTSEEEAEYAMQDILGAIYIEVMKRNPQS